jgi:hypothetical protein
MKVSKCLDYIVTHPDGHEEMIHGLEAFRLEHGLEQSSLTRVARGQAHHHGGFTIRYAVGPFPVMPGSAPNNPLTYVITHPGGQEETIIGLPAFCKEHGLTRGHMTLIAQGRRSQHKGYGCRYADPDMASRYPVRSRARTVKMVPCEVCGKSFEIKTSHAKYCPGCRVGLSVARTRAWRAAKIKKGRPPVVSGVS